MNTPQNPTPGETRPVINEQRRRLTKGGLAAPVVIGALLSRPVLGAAPHNCTISGQFSGNVSTHLQGVCSTLGKKNAADWIQLWRNWPGTSTDFYTPNVSRKPYAYARPFSNTPFSQTKFLPAYNAIANNTTVTTRLATVLEVLLGYVPIYDVIAGTYTATADTNFTLTARRPTRASLILGQEAIVTYLNAIADAPDFPIMSADVVTIFNSLYQTGSYAVQSGSSSGTWAMADVLAYFQSLHAA